MAILARLLRKQNLDTLRLRAIDLMGPGWRVLVADMDGRIVHPAGDAPPGPDAASLTPPLCPAKTPAGTTIGADQAGSPQPLRPGDDFEIIGRCIWTARDID